MYKVKNFSIERKKYTINGNVEVLVSKYLDGLQIDSCVSGKVSGPLHLPDEIAGKKILGIGHRAFSMKGITDLRLPRNLVYLGEGSFAFNRISKLSLPPELKIVSSFSFRDSEIEEVDLNNTEEIHYEAFRDNKIKKIHLPETVKVIGARSFIYNQLDNLVIPPSTKEIEEGAFEYNNIENLIIKPGVKVIGEGSFSDNKIKKITIPTSVEVVDSYAFSFNEMIEVEYDREKTFLENASFFGNNMRNIELPINNEADPRFTDPFSGYQGKRNFFVVDHCPSRELQAIDEKKDNLYVLKGRVVCCDNIKKYNPNQIKEESYNNLKRVSRTFLD